MTQKIDFSTVDPETVRAIAQFLRRAWLDHRVNKRVDKNMRRMLPEAKPNAGD